MTNNNDYVKDYLMHHGVQGQKWGVRRLENKAEKQKIKTRIADMKALEAQSKKAKKDINKSDKQIEKAQYRQTVEKGKTAAATALGVIGLSALAATIVKKFVSGGKGKFN